MKKEFVSITEPKENAKEVSEWHLTHACFLGPPSLIPSPSQRSYLPHSKGIE